MVRQPRWDRLLLLMFFVVVAPGCGEDKGLATVEGTITKNGEPQSKLWITFTPSSGGRPGNGRTRDNGHYEITYTSQLKGAHVGLNRVTIGSGGEIDGRGNEISFPEELYTTEVEVKRGSNTLDIDIAK